MSKKKLIIIIVSLLVINVYTLFCFHQSKLHQSTSSHKGVSENDERHSYKLNFMTNIQNSHVKLNKKVTLKDSLSNIFSFADILNESREQILVCRFSELHCESCVNFSIQLLLQQTDTIGKNNILFLGAYRNNKIFNRVKQLYGIHNQNVFNTAELNIPAEELGYPYYLVLHNDLTISDVFVPDKAVPTITKKYMEMISKRYFK